MHMERSVLIFVNCVEIDNMHGKLKEEKRIFYRIDTKMI